MQTCCRVASAFRDQSCVREAETGSAVHTRFKHSSILLLDLLPWIHVLLAMLYSF
jgi:hypothetical protein